jgi:hypothetical protein
LPQSKLDELEKPINTAFTIFGDLAKGAETP